MKKTITLICTVLCVLFMMTACGNTKEDTPSIVTSAFLDAYSKKGEEKIKEYSQWKDYSVKALEIQDSDYIEGVDRKLQKQVYEMMQSFDHSEGKETIQDDSATVQVTMTVYDFEPVIKKGMKEATAKAEELSSQSDISDAQAQAQINTIIFQNMKEAKKTKKKEIVINLVKKDGTWLISNDNADIQNVLIANMQSLHNVNP